MKKKISFHWAKKYSVHNKLIDEEHQHLFSLANRMLRLADKGEDVEKIKEAVTALYEYVKTHFKTEENYMESLNYPQLDEHQEFHGEILDEMNKTLRHSTNIDALVYKFKRLLYSWAKYHIPLDDKEIADFVQKIKKKKAKELAQKREREEAAKQLEQPEEQAEPTENQKDEAPPT